MNDRTNEPKHTPEPWAEDIVDAVGEILGKDTGVIHENVMASATSAVERIVLNYIRGATSAERSARETACVNALAGIEDPEALIDLVKSVSLDLYNGNPIDDTRVREMMRQMRPVLSL